MNIYVGNLSWSATEQDLVNSFSTFGEVKSARLVTDRATGRSRGFAFVEMASREQGQAAINGMNGQDIKGRSVTCNEARPKD